jgi:multidrug efflux system membrane fusion protein
MTDSQAALPPPDAPAALPPHDSSPPAPARRRRRIWLWLVVALVLVGAYLVRARWTAAAAAASAATAKASAARAVPVLSGKVQRRDVPVYLSGLLGTVTPLNTVTVHTRVDGQLISVAYKEGEFVHAGDVLAEIDPRPFQAQLEQAQGQLARDQAQLQNAKVDLERYKTLYAEDSVAKQQLDTQQATVVQDEGVIQSDQANVSTAQLNLTYSRITAPLTGRIGLRLVDPGNIVHAADPGGLLVITQIQPIAVMFPIPEPALAKVLPKVRSGTTLVVDAYDRDQAKLLATGKVLTLDNQVDVATDSVKVKAVFPNTNDALFPNQFVNPRVLVDTLKNVLVVPSAAVQRGPQATYVFVIKADQTVDMRTVDVQLAQGDDTVVKSGVAAGETVVTDGLDKLQPGTLVQTRPAGSAPSSAPTPGRGSGAGAAAPKGQ